MYLTKKNLSSMFQIATSTNKLHFILLFLKVLSIIMALTIEIVFSYLKDSWEFFGRYFVM